MSKSIPTLKKLATLTVAATIAAAAMLTVASPATAATTSEVASVSTAVRQASDEATPKASQADIDNGNLAGTFVTQPDGRSSFDYGAAVAAGVPADFATEFASGVVASGGEIANAPVDVSTASTAKGAEMLSVASCGGRNGWGLYWWGYQVATDSCVTSVIINSIWAGAGAAALAGIISGATGIGAAAGAAAAAVLTIGAGALGVCASFGNGIYWNTLYTGTPFCWGQ
ncbi:MULTISPECIES: hypothetical protein [unclassified Microbacterium]|uniref:hypothetical protein n=1 Tax=unclassified Microbacterium TaxID=2609290 RepID=UPI003666BCDF